MTTKKRTAGLGSVTQLGPARFWARGPTIGGKRPSLGVYETETEADDVRRAAVQQLATVSRTRVAGVSLRDFGERHLDERALDRDPSVKARAARWGHLLEAPFIDDPIDSIASPVVLAWVKVLQRKKVRRGRGPSAKLVTIARGTVRPIVGLLAQIFAAAVAEGLAAGNPAAGIRIRSGKGEDAGEVWTYLEPDEQRALLTCPAIPESDRLFIGFALGTGLRLGEQTNLELRDLHVDGARPHVVVRWGSKGRRPKNGRIRQVPLFGVGLVAARRWLELLPGFAPRNPDRLVFPYPTGARRGPSVHLHRQGRYGDEHNGWRQALAAAGIGREVRWHDLRHTCASSLVAGWWGETWRLEEAREVLGHTSIRITERYAHLAPAVVTALAGRTGGLPVGYEPAGRALAIGADPRAIGATEGAAASGSGCSAPIPTISAGWTGRNPAVTAAAVTGLRALRAGDMAGARAAAAPLVEAVLGAPLVRAARDVAEGGPLVEARLVELFEAALGAVADDAKTG